MLIKPFQFFWAFCQTPDMHNFLGNDLQWRCGLSGACNSNKIFHFTAEINYESSMVSMVCQKPGQFSPHWMAFQYEHQNNQFKETKSMIMGDWIGKWNQNLRILFGFDEGGRLDRGLWRAYLRNSERSRAWSSIVQTKSGSSAFQIFHQRRTVAKILKSHFHDSLWK